MGIFDFVLRGAWKPMSKSPASGATWMLVLVVVATMFVTADSSWLLSEEEEASCLNGKTITGTCKDSSVDVESESNTIKATIKIKKGEKDFEGSITIGNCQIAGKFLGDQVFNVEATGAVNAPIEIVATTSEVTLQGKVANQKGSVCQSPFTLGKDGKAKTTIKLHVDTENIVSVELDSSVNVDTGNNSKNLRPLLWSLILLLLVL
ncbi:hypothetical protein M3Y96_00532800 [Aphelenchoides besseyi]|nr:hypothetical protein M3Y96_00532800 [Aphelenchoides besseyi]